MRKILKILAIVVVLVLAGTYVIYVLDYKGNYNVTAKVNLNIDDNGDIALTEFSSDSEPTSVVQFWDLFKFNPARSGVVQPDQYLVLWELNRTSSSLPNKALKTQTVTVLKGESTTLSAFWKNQPVGSGYIKITVMNSLHTHLCEKTWQVVVGP